MLHPGRIAVARMQPWMDGTCVTVNRARRVEAFLESNADTFGWIKYKTVNIYSFSRSSWAGVAERLDRHISAGKVNGYYETVFAEMVADGSLAFEMVSFDGKPWYEIDTVEDLAKAEKLFSRGTPVPAETAPFPPGYLSGALLNATA
jgi:NDP-sugar pyrophosphorylase family protein